MNNNIKYQIESTPDLLDVRINRLIAKYSNVIEAADDLETHSKRRNYLSSPNTIKLTSCPKENAQKSTNVHTYPIKNNNYFYKFQNSSGSGEEKDDSILISCHRICNSSDSNDTDSDLSSTVTDYKRPGGECYFKSNPKVKFQEHSKHVNLQTSFTNENVPKKSYAEKTTYCRPIRNGYDRRLVSKVMERNAKLQMLLAKYVIRRHKEKEKEKRNNYVNIMKMNDQYYRDSSKQFTSPSVSGKSGDPLLSNDYYDTSNSIVSDSCREMLNDWYDIRNQVFPEYPSENINRKAEDENPLSGAHKNKQHLFPNVSNIRRKHESQENTETYRPYHKTSYEPKIVINDKTHFLSPKPSSTNQHYKQVSSASLYQVSILDIKQSRDVQTHITFGGYNTASRVINESDSEPHTTDNEVCAMMKDVKEVENITTAKSNHDEKLEPDYPLQKISDVTKPSIQDLEGKLDALINLFSSFLSEFQSKKNMTEIKSNDTIVIRNVDQNKHTPDIETIETKAEKPKKRVSIVGNVMTNTSLCALESQLTPSHYLLNMRLEKILHEELDKSNKIRSEIEHMLNTTNQPTVNVEIPTKERSTEVTNSLSKTKVSRSEGVVLENISYRRFPERPDRRIAVNTEPLGLLTLLRLSTEAVKQILSFIPDISWYLTRASRPAPGSTDYVCNICGAAFPRPSQLGVHILSHDLGQTRDCRVCRQTVDSRRPSQLFRCPHCGQRFTRAYCCDLHQRECGHSSASRALLR